MVNSRYNAVSRVAILKTTSRYVKIKKGPLHILKTWLGRDAVTTTLLKGQGRLSDVIKGCRLGGGGEGAVRKRRSEGAERRDAGVSGDEAVGARVGLL